MKKNILFMALMGVLCLFALNMNSTSAEASETPSATPSVSPSVTPSTSPVPSEKPLGDDWFIAQETMAGELVGTVGDKIYLKLGGTTQEDKEIVQEWKSADESAAKVTDKGVVTCLKEKAEGVKITNTIYVDGKKIKELSVVIYISDPRLTKSSVVAKPSQVIDGVLSGVNPHSQIKIKSGNSAIVKINSLDQMVAVTPGVVEITITADGRVLKLKVMVSDPKLNTTWFLTRKNKSKQLSVSGHSGAGRVVYTSSNTSVATVTAAGKIVSKKIGNANIYATVDGVKLTCVVNVTYKKALNVINSSKKVLGKKYSQARRMSKNYYDCSSLVWRMYKKQGVYFGSRTWAPTAAMEAKYMVKKKKKITSGYVSKEKLLPGDVLFISTKKNGRYKNISHTAIYIGNGKIIHANGVKVAYGSYDNYKKTIKIIARPLK